MIQIRIVRNNFKKKNIFYNAYYMNKSYINEININQVKTRKCLNGNHKNRPTVQMLKWFVLK
jgi:hypothetical protein